MKEFRRKFANLTIKEIPTPKYDFQRILFWNTILRNSRLKSLNYIHLYIERFQDLLNDENYISKTALNYIKNIRLKYKIKNLDNHYKIRLMLDGFSGNFYFDKKDFSENMIDNFSKDISNISKKLKYDIEILKINLIENKRTGNIQKIDIFIKENYLPLIYY